MSVGSISPTSSSTSQLTEKQYFVSGFERRAAQQTHFTFSMSPPRGHKTPSSTTSPRPSTEEPIQLRSSSSSTSKDAERSRLAEVSRLTEELARRGKFQDLEKADDTTQSLVHDSITHSNDVVTPGLVSSSFFCF